MKMPKTCLVCNAPHLEMISILRHPEALDSMLKLLLGLQANGDDYLCKSCCSDVTNAFHSKHKFHQFKKLEPELLWSDWVVFKEETDPGDQIETASSAKDPVIKTEPDSDNSGEALKMSDNSTHVRCDKMVKPDLEVGAKLQLGTDNEYRSVTQRSCWATVGGENDSTKPKETGSSSSSSLSQENDSYNSEDCWEYFQREKSVDIENSTDEEKLAAEKDDINRTVDSSESKEVAAAGGQKQLILHCELCNKSYCQTLSLQIHFEREHPDITMKRKPKPNTVLQILLK